MRAKVQERSKAIRLRKQGKSYKEIQRVVHVSKGTLSKWFSTLPLTKKEEKYLKERSAVLQDKGRVKVALANRKKSETRRDRVRAKARIDFYKYRDDPFFTLGLALYWAEGAKKGNYFNFINSDPEMMRIMLRWTEAYLLAEPSSFRFRLYIHKLYTHENCERYWSRACAIPLSQFQRTVYTPTPRSAKKSPEYKGCLRMLISGVDNMITIQTWQKLLSEYYVES